MRTANRALMGMLSLILVTVAIGQVIPPPYDAGAQTPPAASGIAVVPPSAPVPEVPVVVPPLPVASLPPVAPPPAIILEAAPIPEPGFWASLGGQVLSYLLPMLASIVTALLGWVLLLLRAKLGLAVDLTRDSMVRAAVRSAILGAEEWAARQLKIGQVPPGGAGKLSWAVAALRAQFPKLLPADLSRMIDEELGALPGVGASSTPVATVTVNP